MEEIFVVKELKDDIDIYYYNFKGVKTIANRDWLLRRFVKKDYPSKGNILLLKNYKYNFFKKK